MSLKQFYIENATKETLLMEVEHLEAVVSELRAQLAKALRDIAPINRENERLLTVVESLRKKNHTHATTIHTLRKRVAAERRVKRKDVMILLSDGKSPKEIIALGYSKSDVKNARALLRKSPNEPTNNQ